MSNTTVADDPNIIQEAKNDTASESAPANADAKSQAKRKSSKPDKSDAAESAKSYNTKDVSKKTSKTADSSPKSKTSDKKVMKYVHIERPSYLYLSKSLSSPIIGSTSGKCVLREESKGWLKVSCNVPGKGRVDGYLSKNSTPFIRA